MGGLPLEGFLLVMGPQVCPEKGKGSHSEHVVSLNRGVTGEQGPLSRVHVA